jgi:aryl-alcohol dehydrogenase-like predicted oxidoreductase
MTRSSMATPEGTARYRQRWAGLVTPEHFREAHGLWLSSIGLGTYLGSWDDATDRAYEAAIERAIERGCNVIDTAINYRFQRSERAIGRALQEMFRQGRTSRDEIVIATKGGYIPFDREPPRTPQEWSQYIIETFIRPGIISAAELAGRGSHCLSPRYLENQLETSLRNLRLSAVDIYYLHNPEQQLEDVRRDDFRRRMRAAFEMLEEKVAEGKIRFYGTATWNGYRVPADAPDHLSLAELVGLARDVGGPDHHFRVIQVPYNLAMVEALTQPTQTLNGHSVSVIEAALHLGMTVVASASLLQSRLAQGLPESLRGAFPGLRTDAQRALQFVRSTPGITTALVGMSRLDHVEENLFLARTPPSSVEDFRNVPGSP